MRVRSLIVLSVIALIVPAIMGAGTSSAADEDCGVGTTGILSLRIFSIENAIAATAPCAKVLVTSSAKQPQGSTFEFDGSDSVGGDGAPILSYDWDWDGDGTYDNTTGTTPTAAHPYSTPGVYTVKMKVTSGTPTDNASKVASATIVVWPDPNNPPVASFTAPTPVQTGTPQTFDASASRDDD